ncbi:MAG: RsmD family RNA methyltransferase [Oscillospiraceae bacterium]
MRVITGSARGRRLKELEGMETRPTTEIRVKEGLFNVLQFDIEGRRVLDLFAGTGQLGIRVSQPRSGLRCICGQAT